MPEITINPPPTRAETSGGGFNLVWNGNSWTQTPDLVIPVDDDELGPGED